VYVSVRHPDRERLLARQHQSAQATAPEPTGEVLARFPRRGPDGVEQELRVVRDEYQGHRYLAVRLWQRDGRTGQWWPLKGKGISVRLSEAQGVAEALVEGLELAGRDEQQSPTPGRPAPRRGADEAAGRQGYSANEYPSEGQRDGRPPWDTGSLPAAPGIGSGPPDEDL
jgi:hypothetical protein